ncbi:uncharacterized protein LOC117304565 [Asterias rubens]|uniref:uncharacterized protein LOC117304565 n=1 Tax=Asterias rubens TaxID=7604 RepID=UPI001454F302|nr:uncharacterized protein LOC117304565 [Asterias rubens]
MTEMCLAMGLRFSLLGLWVVLFAWRSVDCMNTKTITCQFQGGLCGYTQDVTDDFDWSLEVDDTRENQAPAENNYICACRNGTTLPPGSLSRLISPIYEVKVPSLLSLQFRHFKTEDDDSLLRIRTRSVSREAAGHDEQPFFSMVDDLNSPLPWAILEGKTNVFSSFQLVIEAELGISRNSRVAVDDVIVKLYSYTNQQREKVTAEPSKPVESVFKNTSSILANNKPMQPPPTQRTGTPTPVTTMTSHQQAIYNVETVDNSVSTVFQEKAADPDDEGVPMCFILAVVSTSLLVVFILAFVFVVFSLTRRKRRYRRFHFSHDYEEIQGKEAYKMKSSSVSSMALMKKRPQSRTSHHRNRHSNSRIHSLSSCLSKLSMRDSLHSSIYAEITEADLELAMDRSDVEFGASTTMTTTCTGTWDLITSDGSTSDITMPAEDSYVTSSSMQLFNSNNGSQNDSGWVENIIYEKTSDMSSLESMRRFFKRNKPFKGLSYYTKETDAVESRQRVNTV